MPNIEVFIRAKNEYIKYSITRLLKVPEPPNGKFSAARESWHKPFLLNSSHHCFLSIKLLLYLPDGVQPGAVKLVL